MEKIFNNILGEVFYNEELGCFEGNAEWCGENIGFLIEADKDEIPVISEIVSTADEIIKNQEKWDSIARKYAASQLTELANDWACSDEEEEPAEITEEEFEKRIGLCDISFYRDGEFIFWFCDDDMFAGHSVTVYGDIKNGCNDACIEG